jgi:hypothetical protein
MTEGLTLIGNERVLVYAPLGALLAKESDALDLIGEAVGQDASWVALPVSRLHEDFFRLETRLAGAILQKLVNYGVKLAVVGDITPWLERSKALRDFALETNQGKHFWFVEDLPQLVARLSRA